jgi:hypothetical protein
MSSNRQQRHRGRPSTSKSFKLVPVPHNTPDAQKLGRAFLALVMHREDLLITTDVSIQEAGDGSA